MAEGPTIPEGLENMATETTQSEIWSEKQSHQMNRAISNTEQFKRTTGFVTRVPKGGLQILEEIMGEKFPDLLIQKL